MAIKTHFMYIDKQGAPYQVGLGFLPFVPRKGERFSYITFDQNTKIHVLRATFRVTRVTYEFFGTILDSQGTWENGNEGKGCQVNLYVVPADKNDAVTQRYLHNIMQAARDNFPERYEGAKEHE